MNKVSIIMPYFRKMKYVEKTINSILSQTYKNYELIIIYDDENIEELEFLKKITNKIKDVKILINKNTLGAGYSRNIGINQSSGDYIAFLDADDLWMEDKITIQLKTMIANNYLLSHTSFNIIDEKDNIIGFRKARNFQKLSNLLKSCDIGLSTVMAKKNIFDENCKFAKLKTKEDFVLWLRILKKDIKIYSIDKNLSCWRKTKNSLSSSTIQKLFDGYKVYKNYMKFNSFKSLYYLFCLGLNYLKK